MNICGILRGAIYCETEYSVINNASRSVLHNPHYNRSYVDNSVKSYADCPIADSGRSSGSRSFEPYSHIKNSAEMVRYLLENQ